MCVSGDCSLTTCNASKALVFTDKDGHFAIPAKTGDLISYGMVGYEIDTVYLVNLFPKNVYLRAAINNLNPVNIISSKVSPFLNTIMVSSHLFNS